MEKEYHYGEIVSLKADPTEKMIVRWSVDQIYFCRMLSDLALAEIGYAGSELHAVQLPNPYA
jgi:hypothetical protein